MGRVICHALVTREQVIRELKIPLTTLSLALRGLSPRPEHAPTNEPRLWDTEAVRQALLRFFEERAERHRGKARHWEDEMERVRRWRT